MAIAAAYQSAMFVTHKTQDEMITEYNNQMDMIESTFVSTVSYDMVRNGVDSKHLTSVLTNFNYGKDVTQISFRDTANVTDFSKDIIVQLEAPQFFSRMCGLEVLKFNRPITVNDTYIGVLTLSMSPNRIINQAWKQYLYLVQIMFITLAVILILIWIVLHQSLSPLLSLAEAGKSLTQGNLSVRVNITGSSELRAVLMSFNQMASSIQETLSALRESEEKFRNIFFNSAIGKSITSIDGSIKVNLAFCEMLGYSMEELEYQKWQNLSHPDDYELAELNLQQLQVGDKKSVRFIKRYFKKDGSIIWADVNTVLQRDNDGRPQYYITGVIDITARKQMEENLQAAYVEQKRLLVEADESHKELLKMIEIKKIAEDKLSQMNIELEKHVRERTAQLEASNQELEAFAYSVSHDLRAPLRGIDGWSAVLVEDYQDHLDEKGRQYLIRVRSEAQRMGRLIDDLLRLSHVTRIEMKLEQVNLSDLVNFISARLQEEDKQRQVQLTIQPNLIDNGDPNLLEIMLTNLLSNAFKFTGKQRQAQIEFGKMFIDGCPVYFIRDNGAGFNLDNAKNLFGAFQRMHKQSEFPGTGIGLATVQRIIHRHGGRVWAESKENEGATFYFTISR